MDKRARRKRQIARRATAFLLSLAMVFSVIYLNNRKEISEATAIDVGFTAQPDDSYLPGKNLNITKDTSTVVHVNSPSSQIAFKLPDVPSDAADPDMHYAWCSSAPVTGADLKVTATPVTYLSSADSTVQLYKYKDGIEESGDPLDPDTYQPEVLAVNEPAGIKIQLLVEQPVDLAASPDTTDFEVDVTAGVNDKYKNTDTDTELYYAKNSFYYEKSDTQLTKDALDAVTGWSDSFDSIQTALDTAGNAADGTYYIYKKVALQDGNETLFGYYAVPVTRDFYLGISSGTISANETNTVDIPEMGKAYTISKVKASEAVTVAFDMTEDNASIKAFLDPELTTPKYTATGKNIVILADPTNNGLEKKYHIEISATDKKTESVDVTINYLDGTLTIGELGLEVDGSETTAVGGVYYINGSAQSAKVTTKITTPSSDVSLTAAQLKDSSDAKIADADNVSDETTKFEYPKTQGQKTVYVDAKSSTGKTVSSKGVAGGEITVFYDASAPQLASLQVKQGSHDETLADGATASKEFTATAGFSFQIKATEGKELEESGLASVVAKDSKGTEISKTNTGAQYTFTVSDASGYKGTTETFTVTALDVAGNKSEYKFTLVFSEDKVEIEKDLSAARLNGDSATQLGKFDIVYTIKSDVEIEEAYYTETEDGGTAVPEMIDPKNDPNFKFVRKDGKYNIYTYTRGVSTNRSMILSDITFNAKNTNGIMADKDCVVEFIRIDLIGGTASFSDPSQADKIKIWSRDDVVLKLLLKEGNDGGTYQSGFSANRDETISNLKGADFLDGKGYSYDDAKKEASVMLLVKESADVKGTEVSFTYKDKVGNKNDFKVTVHSDQTVPAIDALMVDDLASPKTVTGDPFITSTFSDNIKVNDAQVVITRLDDSATWTLDASKLKLDGKKGKLPSQTLSELIGETPKDGKYRVTVKVADLPIGTVASPKIPVVSQSVTFVLDNTRPVVTAEIEDAEDIIINKKYTNIDGRVRVNLTAEDANLQEKNIVVTMKRDGERVDPPAVNWKKSGNTYTGALAFLEEGSYIVSITAYDDVQLMSKTKTVQFVIDRTEPEITTTLNGELYGEEDLVYLKEAAKAGFTVKDKHKDPSGNEISVFERPNDGDQPTTTEYVKQKEGVKTYGNDSRYSITYEVTDLAGNVGVAEITFVIDKEKPVTEIEIQNPADAAKYNKYNTTYKNTESGKTYSYAQYYNHDVSMNLKSTDPYVKDITVKDNGVVMRNIKQFAKGKGEYNASYSVSSEGTHKIEISSTDKSGNASSVQSVTFIIDKTNPVLTTTLNGTTFSQGEAERYLKTNGTVAVTVSDTNKDSDDLTRVAKITPPNSGTTSSEKKVGEGSEDFSTEADYSVDYQAVDRAGNKSAVRTVSFRVDKTAPELRISGAAEGGTSTQSVSAVYNVVEAFYQDMVSATVKVYKKVDGSGESLLRTVDFKATGPNSSMTEQFADDGEYRFEFDAEDRCGNVAHTAYSFLVDATAPVITLSGVNNYEKTKKDVELGVLIQENFYLSNTLTIKGTRQDIDGKKTDIEFSGFNIHSGREVPISQIFKEDGIYDIEIISKDRAGNETKQSVHFTIDKTAPVIGDLSRFDGKKLGAFAWDVDENALVKDLTVCDVTIYLDGLAYDGVSEVSDGAHVLRVSAVDELKNASDKEVNFQLDAIAPNIIVSGIEDQDRIEEPVDVTVSLQIDEDTLESVMLNGKQIDLQGNTASFKVSEAGDYNLVVKAKDAANNEGVLEWSFTYGSKFNWTWVIIAGGAALLLLILLIVIRKKSWSKK